MLYLITAYERPRGRKKSEKPIWLKEVEAGDLIELIKKAHITNLTIPIEILPVPRKPVPYRIEKDGIV